MLCDKCILLIIYCYSPGPGSSVMPTNRTSPPTTEHSTTVSSQGNIDCVDRRPLHYIAQRGDYWVLYNYIVATTQFR